jgi:hypothetical protein
VLAKCWIPLQSCHSLAISFNLLTSAIRLSLQVPDFRSLSIAEVVTTDLVKLTPKLNQLDGNSGTVLEDEQAFVSLYNSYNTLARESLPRLNSMKVAERHRKWKSLGQAIRMVWTEEKMLFLARTLLAVKKSLEFRVLVV